MPNDLLLPIYYYATGTTQKAREALALLAGEKERIMASGIPSAEKMYQHIEKISARIDSANSGSIIDQLDLSAASYLEKDVVEEFVKNPANNVLRGMVSAELLFIAAATGLVEDAYIFAPEELDKMDEEDLPDDDKDDFFQRISYIETLRYMMIAEDANLYIPHLRRQVATSYYDQSQMEYGWEDAFTYSMILRTMWAVFELLSVEDRELLIGSSLYLSVVSGAPVANILREFFSARVPANDAERREYIAMYWKFVEGNQEIAPLDIAKVTGKKVNEIVKNYTAYARSETADGFTLKKFVDDLYGVQPGRDPYCKWLREAISIILHMKNGDWTPEAIKN